MPNSPAAKRIKHAYLELLERFPDAPITVTQIAQLACVNRVTFYRLYETQEAVLLDILDGFDRENMAFMSILDLEPSSELPVRQMLELHRANMPMLRTVLRSNMAPVLERRIEDGTRMPIALGSLHSSMLVDFYVAGVSKVICEWILGGCSESVDELLTLFRETTAMLLSQAEWVKQRVPPS